MSVRVHSVVLAFNEEVFIRHQLAMLYPFCVGISVLAQYDRDWYGRKSTPDWTLRYVSEFPDLKDNALCRPHIGGHFTTGIPYQ